MIKNWRLISFLNVDTKLISKALSQRIKNILPCIVSESQTVYINKRFTCEGGRLIDDLLEFCDMFKKEDFLVTIDNEKALNSLNHNFNYNTWKNWFWKWIHQSFISINGLKFF